jgi:hypothetical protein
MLVAMVSQGAMTLSAGFRCRAAKADDERVG